MTDREELRKLAEAATPGPWTWDDFGSHPRPSLGNPHIKQGEVLTCAALLWPCDEDAAYIVAANPAAVLDLLDQCDAAEAKLAAYRQDANS